MAHTRALGVENPRRERAERRTLNHLFSNSSPAAVVICSGLAPGRRRPTSPFVADNLSRVARSHAMRQVHSRNTSPEIAVRKMLRGLGLAGYRVHRRDLPGNPDIAWIGKRRALFVHGCFWHGHRCKRGGRLPATNQAYWSAKILRNRTRDALARASLRKAGWDVVVIWECELRNLARVERRLRERFG